MTDTHGRRGLEGYLLGSVVERVVRPSPAPVLAAWMLDEDEQEPATTG